MYKCKSFRTKDVALSKSLSCVIMFVAAGPWVGSDAVHACNGWSSSSFRFRRF